MLKIAVVTRYFPSSAEPAQGRFAYQTLRLLARSACVRVFYPNAVYPSFLRPRSRTYDTLDTAFRTPDVGVGYYNYPAIPLVSRPLNGWMEARTLLPHVRAFAPDIIVSYFLYPAGYAALEIGRALSVPVVAVTIGSDINRIGDPISAWHTRAVLRGADFLVTVSDHLRRKALTMGASPKKCRTIANGCELTVFRVRDRAEARRKVGIDPAVEAVVYIGRMDGKKGLRELVEAAASLHAARPRLRVYLLGDGPDRELVRSAIRASHAVDYIQALPGCTSDDVAVWMAAANLVALPSYMEGAPNVVREALACGRPVVATNVGGIPEMMTEASGRLVPPRDSAALAHAIAEVLDGAWDEDAIAAQGSRSWDAVAAELRDVVEAVAARRPGADKLVAEFI